MLPLPRSLQTTAGHAHDFSESGIENKSHSCHVECILHPGAILPPCVVPESLPWVKDLFTELCSE